MQESKRESLPLEYEERGKDIAEHKTKIIDKGDPSYPDAVWSYLESQYGYLCDYEH